MNKILKQVFDLEPALGKNKPKQCLKKCITNNSISDVSVLIPKSLNKCVNENGELSGD